MRTTRDWTAAHISEFDQILAAANAELDSYIQVMRAETAEAGTGQAMVNMNVYTRQFMTRPEVAALMVTALVRLAGQESAPS